MNECVRMDCDVASLNGKRIGALFRHFRQFIVSVQRSKMTSEKKSQSFAKGSQRQFLKPREDEDLYHNAQPYRREPTMVECSRCHHRINRSNMAGDKCWPCYDKARWNNYRESKPQAFTPSGTAKMKYFNFAK